MKAVIRVVRTMLAGIAYLASLFMVLVAVLCLIDGLSEHDAATGIGSAIIALLIAGASFAIGWFIMPHGRRNDKTSVTTYEEAPNSSVHGDPGKDVVNQPAQLFDGLTYELSQDSNQTQTPVPLPSTPKHVIPQSDYVVLDLETTGFNPQDCEIIDVGILHVRENSIVGEWSQLIDPHVPIPPIIVGKTGINDLMVAGKPSINEVIGEIRQRIGDIPILGHNIGFDVGFLNQAFRKANLPELHNELIDTYDISRQVYPDATGHSLQDVMRRVGLDREERHRALDDAKDTLEVYLRLKTIDGPQPVDDEERRKAIDDRKRRTKQVFRSRVMGNVNIRNDKPYGDVLPSKGGVEIVGEEEHQDKLAEYGPGAWFWVELRRGVNPKGVHAGEPTILVFLDGEPVGWMTPLNTSRHYHQVPEQGIVALAHTKAGKTTKVKLDIRVEMPEAEPASEEYSRALRKVQETVVAAVSVPARESQTSSADEVSESAADKWQTVNAMPHKKNLTGDNTMSLVVADKAVDALADYDDGTHLWVVLRRSKAGTLDVKLGRRKLGALDPDAIGELSQSITEAGSAAMATIHDKAGIRTLTLHTR